MNQSVDAAILCDRCLKLLRPGRGEFYVVRVIALADPSPPDLDAYEEQDVESIRHSYEELLKSLDEVSEIEAREQVYRHATLTICNDCFDPWYKSATKIGEEV